MEEFAIPYLQRHYHVQPLELIGGLSDISQYDAVFVVFPVWWGDGSQGVGLFCSSGGF